MCCHPVLSSYHVSTTFKTCIAPSTWSLPGLRLLPSSSRNDILFQQILYFSVLPAHGVIFPASQLSDNSVRSLTWPLVSISATSCPYIRFNTNL